MPIDINTGCSGDESEGNSENESFQKAESNGGYNHFSIEANLRTVPFAGVLVVVLLLVLLIGLDSAEPLRAATPGPPILVMDPDEGAARRCRCRTERHRRCPRIAKATRRQLPTNPPHVKGDFTNSRKHLFV